jgi:hypothetical protein
MKKGITLSIQWITYFGTAIVFLLFLCFIHLLPEQQQQQRQQESFLPSIGQTFHPLKRNIRAATKSLYDTQTATINNGLKKVGIL